MASRQRASSASTSSRRCAAPSPRRASAARTASGSRRISLRSSTQGGYPPRRSRPGRRASPGVAGALARVLGEELRDLARLLPGDDVLGHDRAGEATVLDRVDDVVDVLLAVVEVRAVLALAVGDVERRALRAGGARACGSRRSARRRASRPAWSGSSLATSTPDEPQPAPKAAAAARQAAIRTRSGHGRRRSYGTMPQAMSRCDPHRPPSSPSLAVVLGGCGDDDVFRTDRPILRITLDEYRIVPQNVVVKPGRLKFTVRNTRPADAQPRRPDPEGTGRKARRRDRRAHRDDAARRDRRADQGHARAGRVPARLHDRQPRRPRPVRRARRCRSDRARAEGAGQPGAGPSRWAHDDARPSSRRQPGPAPGDIAADPARASATRSAASRPASRSSPRSARRPAGMTTNAVTSLSLDPLLLIVCFELRSRTLEVVRASRRFASTSCAPATRSSPAVFASKRVGRRSSRR